MRWLLGAAALVLGVGLLGLSLMRATERGRFASAYSTYGAGPEGGRGVFMLADALGAAPRRWVQDLAGLPARGLLVALGGCDAAQARPLSRYEQAELSRWVAHGGHLLVAGARQYLPETFGVSFAPEDDCVDAVSDWFQTGDGGDPGHRGTRVDDAGTRVAGDRRDPADAGLGAEQGGERSVGAVVAESGFGTGGAAPASSDDQEAKGAESEPGVSWVLASPAPSGPLAGLEELVLAHPGDLVLEAGLEHDVLASVAEGPDAFDALDALPSPVTGPVAVRVPHGRGSLTVLASASLFQNRYLEHSDGGVVFARLFRSIAPEGPVLFDEYHLGVGQRRSAMRYLRERGALPVVAQILLVALVLLLRAGVPFGARLRPVPTPPPGTSSFVSALGSLFARTRDRPAAAAILAQAARRRIADHYHLGATSATGLMRQLSHGGHHQAVEAVQEIEGIERAVSEPGSLQRACLDIDAAVKRACRDALQSRGKVV
ncbi:MAG: hypothetical protein OXR73_02025 [Myxococcales bacterium]|nr:hypothetical protein [Myxococcales bacterium]